MTFGKPERDAFLARCGGKLAIAALDRHGIEYKREGSCLKFALREERTPSVVLHAEAERDFVPGFWKDFGSGNSGSAFDLVAVLSGLDPSNRSHFPRIIEECVKLGFTELAASNNSRHSSAAPEFGPEPDVDTFAARYGLRWSDFVAEGFSLEEFPRNRDMKAVAYPVRLLSGRKATKYKTLARMQPKDKRDQVVAPKLDPRESGVIGNLARAIGKPLVLAGGEEKMLAARQAGYAAVCYQAGETRPSEEAIQLIAKFKPSEVIIAYDPESIKGARQASAAFQDAGIPTRIVAWNEATPAKYDLNDLLRDRGVDAVKELLASAVSMKDVDIPPIQAPAVEDEWPDPQPLEESIASLPTFPLDCLPWWVRNWALEMGEQTQTPPCLSAVTALGIVNAALIGRLEVHPSAFDWWEPVTLYALPTMESGETKGPVFKAAVRPMIEHERRLQEAARVRMKEADRQRAVVERQLKVATRAAAEDAHASKEVERLQNELESLESPKLPVLFSNDITPEQLAFRMHENGGWALIMDTEGGVFQKFMGLYSQGVPNIDLLLKGYSVERVAVERRNMPEPLVLPHPYLGMLISPQPHVIATITEKPGMEERGLAARFFYSFPAPLPQRRMGRPKPLTKAIVAQYEANVTSLCKLPPSPSTKYGEWALWLEPEAEDAWIAFREALEPRRRGDGDLVGIRSWIAKADGLCLRIAALLHAAGKAEEADWQTQPIGTRTMESAIRIVADYAIPHAQYAYRLMGVARTQPVANAKKVLEIIRKIGKLEPERREILMRSKHTMPTAELNEACRLLEKHGFLEPIWPENGKAPVPVAYRVHPKVLATNGSAHQ